jgi:hypothetical protein
MNERMNRIRNRINQVFQEEYQDFIPAEEAVFILSSLISYIAMPEVFEVSPAPVEITPAQQALVDQMKTQTAPEVIPNQDFMDGFMTAASAPDVPEPKKGKNRKKWKAESISSEGAAFESDDLF